jgi:hypothetical protein
MQMVTVNLNEICAGSGLQFKEVQESLETGRWSMTWPWEDGKGEGGRGGGLIRDVWWRRQGARGFGSDRTNNESEDLRTMLTQFQNTLKSSAGWCGRRSP